MSAISDKYTELGGANSVLGNPTSPEAGCADEEGRYRHYEHGSIFWHRLTGAHEVHGLIHAKWLQLRAERGFLGYPRTDELPSGGGAKGRYNLFKPGSAIIYKDGATEAFETHGAIRSKFGELGWEAGFLGFPTTDETKTPDGKGRFNHFDGGSIYWKRTISAHEVHGLIRQYWSDHGWETNPELGYPISDETPTYPGSPHRFSDFENGVVYWSSGNSRAVSLSKLTNGSLPADQILPQIKTTVKGYIPNSNIYITKGPSLAKLTDYRWDGSLHNRMYKIRVDVGINIKYGLPDASSILDFWMEVVFDRQQGLYWTTLYKCTFKTHVPDVTSAFYSAEQINSQLKAAIDPLRGLPRNTQKVPDGRQLLSAKVMPNRDLNIYLQPIFQF